MNRSTFTLHKLCYGIKQLPQLRHYAVNAVPQKLTTIELDSKTAIATLTLNRMPANTLNAALLKQLKADVHEIEKSKCRGLILTSASERIFSAGLDLTQAYQQDVNHLTELWTALQDMWQALFSTQLNTVALINGHATAGGCMMALACDYRIMLPNFLVGMNETQAGVAVPQWVISSYLNVICSRRVAEADLMSGKLYDSAGALEVGLIDELVPTKAAAYEKCLAYFDIYKKTDRFATAKTKQQFRADILQQFEREREEDVKSFVQGIQRPEVQEFLGNYLQSLKQRKAKK